MGYRETFRAECLDVLAFIECDGGGFDFNKTPTKFQAAFNNVIDSALDSINVASIECYTMADVARDVVMLVRRRLNPSPHCPKRLAHELNQWAIAEYVCNPSAYGSIWP